MLYVLSFLIAMSSNLPTCNLGFNSIRSHRSRIQCCNTTLLFTSDVNCKSRLSSVLLTNQLQIGGPRTPLLGSGFARALPEHGKTFYFIDYQFIIKENVNQNRRMKRCIGQGWEEEHRAAKPLSQGTSLPKPPYVHQPRSSPNPIFMFLWMLHYISITD